MDVNFYWNLHTPTNQLLIAATTQNPEDTVADP